MTNKKNSISPSAAIEGYVKLGKGVTIGRFCHIKGSKKNPTVIGDGVALDDLVTVYDGVHIGAGSRIGQSVMLGYMSKRSVDRLAKLRRFFIKDEKVLIGKDSVVRPYSVIYKHTNLGRGLKTGIGAIIREHTRIGHSCVFGTYASTDGYTIIGDRCHIGQYAQLSQSVEIGDFVFVGGHSVFSDNRFMLPDPVSAYNGASVGSYARIGLNCTVLSGVKIGESALVGAGSVVASDVQECALSYGIPARKVRSLSDKEINAYKVFFKTK